MPTPSLLTFAQAANATYAADAVPMWQDDLKTVHVFMSEINGTRCIAWEGTHDFWEWIIDFMALEVPIADYGVLGPVHLGFIRDVLAVADAIYLYFHGLNFPPYYNIGHSKGASEAILAHAVMKMRGHPPLATRAFEPAKPGSAVLRAYLAGEDIIWTQTVNARGTDLVTQAPFGPTWCHAEAQPVALTVPDSLDIADKHRLPAIIGALAAGAAAGGPT